MCSTPNQRSTDETCVDAIEKPWWRQCRTPQHIIHNVFNEHTHPCRHHVHQSSQQREILVIILLCSITFLGETLWRQCRTLQAHKRITNKHASTTTPHPSVPLIAGKLRVIITLSCYTQSSGGSARHHNIQLTIQTNAFATTPHVPSKTKKISVVMLPWYTQSCSGSSRCSNVQ